MIMNMNVNVRTVAAIAMAGSVGFAALMASEQAQTGQAGQAGQAGQQQGRGGGAAGRGQAPARDAQVAPATGTGIISGVVTTAGTGTPVRRARLTLSGAELRGGR